MELAALDCLIMKHCVSIFFSAVFDPILFILVGNFEFELEFRPDPTSDEGVSYP